jgi:hypothetical protein
MTDAQPLKVWSELRQGARNVAGVRYQIAVTALLLVESRGGNLPFVSFVPEGLEDVDCETASGDKWFVQAKESAAGAGTFTASDLAEVILHASAAAPGDARIVAVTDARVGGQLRESGWFVSVAETPGVSLNPIRSALTASGISGMFADELIARTHLVVVPWSVGSQISHSIAKTYEIPVAAASLIFSALLDDLLLVAADQRFTQQANPGIWTLNKLDVLRARVLEVIDLDSLTIAERNGICEPADFSSGSAASGKEFLLGIDASPSHIGAGFDVSRHELAATVTEALSNSRYVLLVGPSGAGKSTQLWRSAANASPGARVVRVRRIETAEDALLLVRHVRVLLPTQHSPVVVVCDDLGRIPTGQWPGVCSKLLETPHVLLLAAARHEDFTADLLRHGGELVSVLLDDSTAMLIADQLASEGVPLRLEIPEAITEAGGHLMEFIALLTSGRRLRSVLSDQLETLARSGGDTPIIVARTICTAHTLGVSLTADSLQLLDPQASSLTAALRRLQDEHLVTSPDRQSWQGLHQLRSEYVSEILHETPPPVRSTTFRTVLSLLGPGPFGWASRRIVERFEANESDLVEAAIGVGYRSSSALALALLLEGLERTDNALTARQYIPVLERHRRSTVPMDSWSFLVLSQKIAGLDLGGTGSDLADRLTARVSRCANELPEQTTLLCESVITAVGTGALVEIACQSGIESGARLLDAAAPYLRLGGEHLEKIAQTFFRPFETPPLHEIGIRARLLKSAAFASDSPDLFAEHFGSVSERVDRIASVHPNIISTSVAPTGSIQVEVLAPTDHYAQISGVSWEVGRPFDSDYVHSQAVDVAFLVGEACPEVELVEVRTLNGDLTPFVLFDHEPGHKRLGRNARPDPYMVRRNVGLGTAISRQTAAASWTDLVRSRAILAAELCNLVTAAHRRLGPFDNRRRSEIWSEQIWTIQQSLADLPEPPEESHLSGSSSIPGRRQADLIASALAKLTTALTRLPSGVDDHSNFGIAAQLSDAATDIRKHLTSNESLLATGERSLLSELTGEATILRQLLVSLHYEPTEARNLKGTESGARLKALDIIERVGTNQRKSELEMLTSLFDADGIEFVDVAQERPFVSSILGHEWLLLVPADALDETVGGGPRQVEVLRRTVSPNVTIIAKIGNALTPIGFQLSTMSPNGLIATTPEAIKDIAKRANRAILIGRVLEATQSILGILVMTSNAIALAQNRTRASLPACDIASSLFDKAEAEIARIAIEAPESAGILRCLVEHVSRERDGTSDSVFGADVAKSVDGSGSAPTPALELMSTAVIRAIEFDLQNIP